MFDLALLGLLSTQIVCHCVIVIIIVLATMDWKEQADMARELIRGINVSKGENNEVSIVLLNKRSVMPN